MDIAILILTILSLLATVAFPISTLIKNRLQFNISILSMREIEDGPYDDLEVIFKIKNLSKYPINIHKIVLTTGHDRHYIGYNNYSAINNRIVDENEEFEFNVTFNKIHYTIKPYRYVTVFTNKKSYNLPISLDQ